jgi:hypothetical protein
MIAMTATDIARICHEANRALQTIQADPTIPVSPAWDDLDHETRSSAIDGVAFLVNTGAGPAESHTNWLRFKREHGWKLGPVKDETKKEHPLMVPYELLPGSQQVKDSLFHAIVTALAGSQ